jgi:hypothetical protein
MSHELLETFFAVSEKVDKYATFKPSLTRWLLACNEVVLAENGGLEGLRDGAILHSAIARPADTLRSYSPV